jgi:HD-GYP domain-containing protein (c-di-GMP phosphodiesterase class II)
MFAENNISIYDFVCALSEAVDLVCHDLNTHHKKVAYISWMIAQEMKLSNDEVQDIILASMLHDIGAFTIEERMKLLTLESGDIGENRHAILGYKLLKSFTPLTKVATLIRHHHSNYDKARREIPLGSYIIHLADKVAVLLDERREILKQVPEIRAKISGRQNVFHPRTFMAFTRLANLESFWIEAFLPPLGGAMMLKKVRFSRDIIDLETLRKFAKIVAHLIDFRSRFTATHSSGVAAVALELAILDGFSERECKLMEIAGFFHDLGKLTVPNSILEKNSALTQDEFHSIRKHTYYTYVILSKINGLESIATWAAYHHERPDGKGYPFHVQGENFSKLARIMAVADVMTALMEDRPYSLGMEREKATKILRAMVENGGLDENIVGLVDENFLHINNVRKKAQSVAQKEYEDFYNAVNNLEKRQEAHAKRHAPPVINLTDSHRRRYGFDVINQPKGPYPRSSRPNMILALPHLPPVPSSEGKSDRKERA